MTMTKLFHAAGNNVHQDVRIIDDFGGIKDVVGSQEDGAFGATKKEPRCSRSADSSGQGAILGAIAPDSDEDSGREPCKRPMCSRAMRLR